MRPRSTLIDTLKIVSSQLIVLHHLSVYSPMARQLEASSPVLLDFLFEQGRWVVQCFLVIAGFLAAQAALTGRAVSLRQAVVGRYLRLAPQFVAALLLVLLATWWVQPFYRPEWVSEWPSLKDFVAHVFMLQGVMDVPALSAGAWYVAIDFQLYVSFALLMAVVPRTSQTPRPLAVVCVTVLTGASLWGFNRLSAWDAWALYFWGAYGLGVLAAWGRASAWASRLFLLLLCLLTLDLVGDFRARPALAAVTAAALWGWGDSARLPARLRATWRLLSDASYAIFLVHFAVIVCASAVWSAQAFAGTAWAWGFVLITWVSSVGLGMALNRWVKTPKSWAGAAKG